jgi:hypothetical protein
MYSDTKKIIIGILTIGIGYIIYMLFIGKPKLTVTRVFSYSDKSSEEEKNIEDEMKKTYEKMGYTDAEIEHKMDKFEELKKRYANDEK